MAKTLLQRADTKRAIPGSQPVRTRAAGEPPRAHSVRDAPRAPFTQSRGPLVRSNCSNSGNRARSFLSTRIPSPFISILSSRIPIPSLGFLSLARGPAILRRFVLLVAPPPATPRGEPNRGEVSIKDSATSCHFFADLTMTIFADLFDRTCIEDFFRGWRR
jgi:hypothetical protein